MCGIAGSVSFREEQKGISEDHIKLMTDAIAHRGPDSDGFWVDEAVGVCLGHRRLAILDLSAAGHQPMTSDCGRFVLTYNGEVYNHLDLRKEIDAGNPNHVWKGTSDTETLIVGFATWGVTETLARANGMFAIALWDREDRTLTLVRDRLGEKPLFYGWQGQGTERTFLFGSELKALAAHPSFEGDIDRDVLPEFLRHGHIGEDRSIYCGISKLRPGEIVVVPSVESDAITRAFYWSYTAECVQEKNTLAGSTEQNVDALNELLLVVVDRQMLSDVPLGAFLSGGIDSSAVVGLMQHLSERPVRTFSIGFNEKRYNEAEHAKAVASHLGTDHTEIYVGNDELLDVIPRIPQLYDEPFADSSQIPTFLVAQLARRDVSVALSGDGGDELFCGYDRYLQGAQLIKKTGRIPGPLRNLIGSGVQALPKSVLDRLIEPIRKTPQGKEPNGQRMHRLAHYLKADGVDDLHRRLVSRWLHPELAVPGANPRPTMLDTDQPERGDLSDPERMMQLDLLTYLPDDILAKVDRATMAVSLESRAPFLDHDVVAFSGRVPFDQKYRDGQSKWILRQVLYRYVPKALIERPKMGFEVPIGLWLRGPLKDWAAALLDPVRIKSEGWFAPDVIAQHWDEHQSGRCNWGSQLWNVLMFQQWLEAQK